MRDCTFDPKWRSGQENGVIVQGAKYDEQLNSHEFRGVEDDRRKVPEEYLFLTIRWICPFLEPRHRLPYLQHVSIRAGRIAEPG